MPLEKKAMIIACELKRLISSRLRNEISHDAYQKLKFRLLKDFDSLSRISGPGDSPGYFVPSGPEELKTHLTSM